MLKIYKIVQLVSRYNVAFEHTDGQKNKILILIVITSKFMSRNSKR